MIAMHLMKVSKACKEGSLMKDIKLDGVGHSEIPEKWFAGLPNTGMLEYVSPPDSY
jgi:hypothetical protein